MYINGVCENQYLNLYNPLKIFLDISFHDLLRCQVVIGRKKINSYLLLHYIH